MSYLLKRVQIKGFQRIREVDISLHKDVNFIIGRNGTGKTSFVKLVHACLALDAEELLRIEFETISISFTDTDTNLTPSLKVIRSITSRRRIQFHFRGNGSQRYTEYIADYEDVGYYSYFDDEILRHRRVRNLPETVQNRTTANPSNVRALAELKRTFSRKIEFSWLPLLRSRQTDQRRDFYPTEYAEEPINRKIKELTGQITSYLAVLDTRVSEANRRFQREVFLSYIEKGLFDVRALKRIDADQERQQLMDMFKEMEYPTSDLPEKLDSFFKRTQDTQETIEEDQGSFQMDDVVNVVSVIALHRIVMQFQRYTSAKQKTLYPQTQFLEILNDLLYQKTAFFDEGNVLNVKLSPNDDDLNYPRKMEVTDLSSGEKQILVILSEALLQQGRQFIFIADEPELSLHVEWQERLVKIIREMNENAQIIFATHSPDIVSIYQDNVIDFERI